MPVGPCQTTDMGQLCRNLSTFHRGKRLRSNTSGYKCWMIRHHRILSGTKYGITLRLSPNKDDLLYQTFGSLSKFYPTVWVRCTHYDCIQVFDVTRRTSSRQEFPESTCVHVTKIRMVDSVLQRNVLQVILLLPLTVDEEVVGVGKDHALGKRLSRKFRFLETHAVHDRVTPLVV